MNNLFRQAEGKKFDAKIVIFLFGFFIFSTLYFLIKSLSPHFVQTLFELDKISLLNTLTKNQTQQPLEFYLGRSQETLFGPLCQIISGFLLAWLGLLFLQEANRFQFGLVIFIFLVITKWEVLTFPAYGDAIGGPFAEAVWLKRHNFDYAGLFHQAGYAAGGPKVYFFTIYPTLLALLMKLIPSTETFLIVSHLIVFAISSLIVSILREILLKMFPKDFALLVPLVLLSLPLFQSQTEAINMEIPTALFMSLSSFALMEKKIHRAGIMAIMAVLVKGTGVISCCAFFLVGLLLFFSKGEFRFNLKILFWMIALCVVGFFIVAVKFIFHDQHVTLGHVKFWSGWVSMDDINVDNYYLVSLFLFICFYLKSRFNLKRGKKESFPRFNYWYEAFVMFVFAGMWFVLFLNFETVNPRYRIHIYPFLIFCVFCVYGMLVQHGGLRRLGILCALGVVLWSSYGFFQHPMEDNDHVQLERSLEYRNDLEVNRRMVKTLEEKYADNLIAGHFIIAQLIAIPELGYVKKKLDVMIYGFRCTYGNIRNFLGIQHLDLNKTIFVGVKVAQLHKDFAYPIGPYDKIIEEIQYGDKKNSLFRGGVAIDTLYRASVLWQLRKTNNK